MAQFIIGNSRKDLLTRWPWLRNTIWRLESFILGTLLGILSWLPADSASAIGRSLGRFLGPRLPKHRNIIRNLRLAFPDKSRQEIEAIADGIWGNAGSVLTEFACLDKICNPARIDICYQDGKDSLLGDGRPKVLVAAHMANWEVLAWALTRKLPSVAAPYTAPSNPWLARRLESYRAPLGVQLFERDSSMRPLVTRIRSGESLVFLSDLRVDSGKPAAFLGMDKLTSLVPARLALRFDCDLIPVRVERLHGARFRISFHTPIRPRNPDSSEPEQALDMTRQMNGHFGNWIRERPEDWFCSNRMWPKQLERRLRDEPWA